MNRSRRPLFLAALTLATLLLAAAIFTDALPLLRGPAPETSEWYWPYRLRPFSRWWAPLSAAGGMLAVAAWWLRSGPSTRGRTAVALAALVGGSLLLQIAFVYTDRADVAAELVDRTLSNLASGFFEPAAEIEDLNAALRAYPELMPTFASEHARTHPPGLILANRLTIDLMARFPNLSQRIAAVVWPQRCIDLWLLDRPPAVAAALGIWAVLPLLAGALTVLPTYALARRWFSPAPARLAALLTGTLPALLLFAPKSVQFYAPLGVTAVLALDFGLFRQSWRWYLLSGLLISLATYLSLGNAALLLALAAYALLTWRQRQTWPTPIQLLAFLLGTAAVWLVYWLGWGAPPWTVARTGLQQHYQLVTLLRRYDWWLAWNLIDLVVYAGLPLVVGFIGYLLLTTRNRRGWKQPSAGLALGLLLLIVALDVSGSARGEVGRLWLFFMPLLALPAAAFFAHHLPGWRGQTAVIGLQLLLALALGMAWRPVRAVIVVAEPPSMPDVQPETAVDAIFQDASRPDNALHLTGYTLEHEDAALSLTLFWRADEPTLRPYTTFTHLINENGELTVQKDNWAVNGRWPPTCWQPGATVVDPYRIPLSPELPRGDYRLFVGLYDARSDTRLTTPAGRDAVRLETITLP